MIASISAEFSDILRASSFTARSSAATADASGLVEEAVERTRASILPRAAPRVSAAAPGARRRPPTSPPRDAMSLSWGPSDRSTSASKAGHDSSRMLRSRFLFLVFSQVRKFLWAASALAAATVGPGSPTGRSASGMPSAVFAMTIASRSSVLASPAKTGGPVRRESRQVRRRHPGRPARASARAPMLRDWSTTTSASGKRPNSESGSSSLFATGGAQQHLAISSRDACPVGRFPDIEPDDGFRHSNWCHGGILQSVGRSEPPRDTHITGRGACARQFPISRPGGERPRWQHPRALYGQGQTAIRRRPIGGPSGLARIVGNAPNARHRIFIDSLFQTVMGEFSNPPGGTGNMTASRERRRFWLVGADGRFRAVDARVTNRVIRIGAGNSVLFLMQVSSILRRRQP